MDTPYMGETSCMHEKGTHRTEQIDRQTGIKRESHVLYYVVTCKVKYTPLTALAREACAMNWNRV